MTKLSQIERTFPKASLRGTSVHTKVVSLETSVIVGFNLSAILNMYGTEVDSVVWTAGNNNISVSDSSVTNNCVQTLLSADSAGDSMLEAKITLADGQIIKQFFQIRIQDVLHNNLMVEDYGD